MVPRYIWPLCTCQRGMWSCWPSPHLTFKLPPQTVLWQQHSHKTLLHRIHLLYYLIEVDFKGRNNKAEHQHLGVAGDPCDPWSRCTANICTVAPSVALLPMLFLESLLKPHSMAPAQSDPPPSGSHLAAQWRRAKTDRGSNANGGDDTHPVSADQIRSDQIRLDRGAFETPPPFPKRPPTERKIPTLAPDQFPYSNLLTKIKGSVSLPKSPGVSLQRAACLLRGIHSAAGAERGSGSRPLPISPWFHFLSYSY